MSPLFPSPMLVDNITRDVRVERVVGSQPLVGFKDGVWIYVVGSLDPKLSYW